MLAGENDARMWTMALNQQEEYTKQRSNYSKDIKKENIVLARMELTFGEQCSEN